MSYVVTRFKPGADLHFELNKMAQDSELEAAAVISLVGSLRVANLRLADGQNATSFQGPLEIVSGTGTVASSGMHIHISFADRAGTVFGGHLLPGSIVYTTCEVVLAVLHDWIFERVVDDETKFKELMPIKK